MRRCVLLLCLAIGTNAAVIKKEISTSITNILNAQENLRRPTYDEFLKQRKSLLKFEADMSFQSDVTLTEDEEMANIIIMRLKRLELTKGHKNPNSFIPSHHIFEVLDDIPKSKLFKILQKMPKGGVIHAHSTALGSANFLVNITYMPHLWQCTRNNEIIQFLFAKDEPIEAKTLYSNCEWLLVADERQRQGAQKFDAYVRTLFTLYDKNVHPKLQFIDINDAWKRLQGLFMNVRPLIKYSEAWKSCFRNALQEMYDDNVQYLEFRSSLHEVYNIDGLLYKEENVMQICIDVLEEFKEEHPDFIGSKFIYAPKKTTNPEIIDKYFANIINLRERFPDYMVGFDLVAQEDITPPISEFAKKILELPQNISLFFHAGETNWYGKLDENMVDSIILGTKRIGHGFALSKHPKLIEIVKEKDIAIEINAISNQVLKLVVDYRNHPAATLFAQNVPLVVSSDDPSFWEVTPLSHDFYMTFLGITSADSDLRTLKKLAMNSLKYSSLNDVEKIEAFAKWQVKWDKFIEEIISNNSIENE